MFKSSTEGVNSRRRRSAGCYRVWNQQRGKFYRQQSTGVDSGKRRRNVYDKKPQRYTKDNRTVHLTACSDKSVACITNNRRLYSTFCTVEANYWQTRSIAQPLCDSRATCSVSLIDSHIIDAVFLCFEVCHMKRVWITNLASVSTIYCKLLSNSVFCVFRGSIFFVFDRMWYISCVWWQVVYFCVWPHVVYFLCLMTGGIFLVFHGRWYISVFDRRWYISCVWQQVVYFLTADGIFLCLTACGIFLVFDDRWYISVFDGRWCISCVSRHVVYFCVWWQVVYFLCFTTGGIFLCLMAGGVFFVFHGRWYISWPQMVYFCA